MNKKGFVFIEAIIVTAVLLSSLMLVISLFVSSNNAETRRLRYDDVNYLYTTYYIKNYLNSFNLSEVVDGLTSEHPYQSIYIGQNSILGSSYQAEHLFWETIINDLHIQSLAVIDFGSFNCDTNGRSLCANNVLADYLKTIDTNEVRLVVEYAVNMNGAKCVQDTRDDGVAGSGTCLHYYSSVKI